VSLTDQCRRLLTLTDVVEYEEYEYRPKLASVGEPLVVAIRLLPPYGKGVQVVTSAEVDNPSDFDSEVSGTIASQLTGRLRGCVPWERVRKSFFTGASWIGLLQENNVRIIVAAQNSETLSIWR
jgi:hypothetical protein